MFSRGIDDDFVQALKKWEHWKEITEDSDLFVAIRNGYINIYYQGCSIFRVSSKNGQLLCQTHYKYLVRPDLRKPYVSWVGESPARDRLNEIPIDKFDLNALKRSSTWYAEDEKKGVHCILKSNRNVIDVEVALSPETENEAEGEDQGTRARRFADRIDFAAIQRAKDVKPCIVFFEAKRFDNGDLRSWKPEPQVFEQIGKYEEFIQKYRRDFEASYRRVCADLVKLVPQSRYDPLVKEVADKPEQLTVDCEVRLVVFGYTADQAGGKDWKDHENTLRKHFQNRLLMRGKPEGFSRGISK